MVRGTTRAPSQNAYRGSLGRTQTRTVQVAGPRGDLIAAQVYTTIDAVSDPELVDRLHSEDPSRALNAVRIDGLSEPVRVAVPVLYHDPAAELLVLVLGEGHRHRELDERIEVYQRLRADEIAVPAYAVEFAVVYGASGLRNYLEHRAQQALEAARLHESTRDAERRRADLAAREGELERTRAEHDKRARELERRAIELEHASAEVATRIAEVERSRLELERLRSEARNRVIAQAQKVSELSESTVVGPPPQREVETSPVDRAEPEAVAGIEVVEAVESNEVVEAIEAVESIESIESVEAVEVSEPAEIASIDHLVTAPVSPPALQVDSGLLTGVAAALDALDESIKIEIIDGPSAGAPSLPQGSDPLTTEIEELPVDAAIDPWLDASGGPSFRVDSTGVALALVVSDQVARGLAGALDLRVLLHRTTSYPVVSLVIGPPIALRAPTPSQLAVVSLDIASDRDRAVLAALGRRFELTIDVFARGQRIRRVKLTAPLAENVGYIVRAAEDHLRMVTAEGEASLERALDQLRAPDFDLLGVALPDHAEFRDDRLCQLETAQQLRRAIAMARRFARPAREDYLVCTRGFPLPRWRELRRQVLESAVAWGLWMGPELAQVAVSEGLARSRRDLVVRLDRGFEALRRHPTAFDIDDDAGEDNAKAIHAEARALGVELSRSAAGARGGAIASDEVSSVSGSIGGTPALGVPRPPSTDELLALLDDKQQRLDAALKLCDRAEARAAAPVIEAACKMGRADAVRVLGMAVKFGMAAKPALLEGLASSKAFLRHGCALALALLRTEDGTQAVIELLLTEPTEIWREVARAIGQVGPSALLPLASTYGRLGERATPAVAERVAWAMAHVAVRGGKGAVETMAGGQSVVAPVAQQALELHASAANDQVRVRPGANGSQPGRDVTVNRAFSRQFFEALEQGIPEAGAAGLVALDASGPMESLDEADLIEDAEDEVDLDDADLIQT